MAPRTRVVAALTARGADGVEHPGGTLLAHLIRTAERLQAWGSSEELVLAGLSHAAYGTDGVDVALFGLHERSVVASLVGEPGRVDRVPICELRSCGHAARARPRVRRQVP
jgi:hypothetical protein